MNRIIIILPIYVLFFIAPDIISACATCYGVPDAQATMGMNWAIITLLGVTGGVLGGMIKTIISIWKKTKKFQQLNN